MTDEAPFWERLSPRAQAAGALATRPPTTCSKTTLCAPPAARSR